MGVHERGRHQRTVELDDLVDRVGMHHGRLVGPDPGDLGVGDDHGGREGVGRAVDESASVQGGHGLQSAGASRDPARGVHRGRPDRIAPWPGPHAPPVGAPPPRRPSPPPASRSRSAATSTTRPPRRTGWRRRRRWGSSRAGCSRRCWWTPGRGSRSAIVPVDRQLDLKAMSTALGTKKVSMADPAAAERSDRLRRRWHQPGRSEAFTAHGAGRQRPGARDRSGLGGTPRDGPGAVAARPAAGHRGHRRTPCQMSRPRYPPGMTSTRSTWWAA